MRSLASALTQFPRVYPQGPEGIFWDPVLLGRQSVNTLYRAYMGGLSGTQKMDCVCMWAESEISVA